MRRVFLFAPVLALAVVAIPGPTARVSVKVEAPDYVAAKAQPLPEPHTTPPAPSPACVLTCDAWECIPAGLGIARPSYGRAAYAFAAPRPCAVRKRPQVWEYG